MDTQERDRLRKELDNERTRTQKVQLDLDLSTTELSKLKKENENLKSKLMRLENMSSRVSSIPLASIGNQVNPSNVNRIHSSYCPTYLPFVKCSQVIIDPESKCKVMASCKTLDTIAVSLDTPSRLSNLLHGAGVKRVRTDLAVTEYIHIHSKAIRDLSFKPLEPLLLTVSDDCTSKLTSLINNRVEIAFNVGAPAWSCCWHPTQVNSCFVGLKNGIVQEYDIRNPSDWIRQFQTGMAVPLCSVKYVKANSEEEDPTTGILCNTFTNAFFIALDSQGMQREIIPLGLEGALLAAHYYYESGIGIVSQ